jgi:hypothetical protein
LVAAGVLGLGAVLGFAFVVFGFAAVLGLVLGAALGFEADFLAVFFAAM